MPSPSVRSLRTHQRQLLGVARAIAAGASGVRDVLAAVTPGGGKSLLPVLMAQVLMQAGVVERVCWVVPRDSLRLQAEEAFADPAWRAALGHSVRVRAAENLPDPCRGLEGYVTTYQGVAAAPDLHLPSSGATPTCWWSTRCIICRRWPSSTRCCRPPRRETRRRAGRRPCCRCSNAPGCGCCCRGHWNAPTGAAFCGCPTAAARAPAPAGSI